MSRIIQCYWITQKQMFKYLFMVHPFMLFSFKPGLPDNQRIPPVAKRAFGQDWGIVGK